MTPTWRARAENIELELRPKLLKNKDTTIRLLNYVNHANMGDYEEAIRLYLAHVTPTPDITATRKQGTVKYGFGINFEQEVSTDIWAFGRWGWNEGEHESFVYTEDNEGVELGVYVKGTRWHRSLDRTGAAFVSSGISKAHQEYLADGGLGFILGDGGLTYGRETIEEALYTAHVWRGIFFAFDLQHINNPGYNQVRGSCDCAGIAAASGILRKRITTETQRISFHHGVHGGKQFLNLLAIGPTLSVLRQKRTREFARGTAKRELTLFSRPSSFVDFYFSLCLPCPPW